MKRHLPIVLGLLLCAFIAFLAWPSRESRMARPSVHTGDAGSAPRAVRRLAAGESAPSRENSTTSERRSDQRSGWAGRTASSGDAIAFPFVFSFDGNRTFTDAQLFAHLGGRQALRDRLPHEIGGVVRESLTDLYRSNGFLDFEISELRVEQGSPVPVEVRLHEGDRYYFGEINYRSSFPEMRTQLQRHVRSGDPADLPALQRAKEEFTAAYHARGYLDFRYEAMYHRDRETKRVNLFFHLEKGPKYRIGEVTYPASQASARALLALEGRDYRRDLVDRTLSASGMDWSQLEMIKSPEDGQVDLVVGSDEFRRRHLPQGRSADRSGGYETLLRKALKPDTPSP